MITWLPNNLFKNRLKNMTHGCRMLRGKRQGTLIKNLALVCFMISFTIKLNWREFFCAYCLVLCLCLLTLLLELPFLVHTETPKTSLCRLLLVLHRAVGEVIFRSLLYLCLLAVPPLARLGPQLELSQR